MRSEDRLRSAPPVSGTSFLHAIVEQAPTPLVVCDPVGRVTLANQAFRTLARAERDPTGAALEDLLGAEDRAAWHAALLQATQDGTTVRIEARLPWGTSPITCRLGIAALATPVSEPRLVVTFEDVTALIRTLDELEENSTRYRLTVDRANDIIFNIDLSGRFTFVNPTACLLTKYREDELVGRHYLTLIRQDARRDAERFYGRQVVKKIPSTYYEYPMVSRDGEVVWLGQYVQLNLDGDRIVTIQAIARDITERRRVEDALRTSEERLRAVISAAPLILWAIDRNGRLTLCEGEALSDLGLTGDELLGRPVSAIFDDPQIESHLAHARAGSTFQVEVSSSGRTFDAWFSPVRSRAGQVTGVIGVAADVTERQRLRERLYELERVEAIGQLASRIAHDFNNQLTAILGYSELLMETLDAEDPRRHDLEEVAKAGQRAATMTAQLLAYGRRQPRRPEVIAIRQVIKGLEPLLRQSVREDIEFEIRTDDTEPVQVDPVQMEHVLLNLVLNARDALSGGGRLTLVTSTVDVDASREPTIPAGRYVVIEVTDTGEGMDEETRERVFEPFFTTKGLGKGTGLGLASVYGMVRQSDGYVTVTSQVERGTTFAIYLPTVSEPLTAPLTSAPLLPERGGSETILIVDDDPTVLTLARDSLAGQGYQVLEARRSPEALDIAGRHDGPIDLLLTDVVMPVMDGQELATRFLDVRPTTRVVFTTGYGDAEVTQRRLRDRRHIIEKPFVPSVLLRKVREVLDEGVAPRGARRRELRPR